MIHLYTNGSLYINILLVSYSIAISLHKMIIPSLIVINNFISRICTDISNIIYG